MRVCPADETLVLAQLHDDLSLAGAGGGDPQLALEAATTAAELYAAAGAPGAEARALGTAAAMLHRLGRVVEAAEQSRASIEASTRLGDERSAAAGWRDLGLMQADLGDLDAAIDSERRSLELYRQLGVTRGIGMALINLGVMLRDRGDVRSGRELLEEAVETFGSVGDVAGQTEALDELGFLHVVAGDAAVGVELLQAGLDLIDPRRPGYWEARIRQRIAAGLERLGRSNDAESHWISAREILIRRGEPDEVKALEEQRAQWG